VDRRLDRSKAHKAAGGKRRPSVDAASSSRRTFVAEAGNLSGQRRQGVLSKVAGWNIPKYGDRRYFMSGALIYPIAELITFQVIGALTMRI
jgi:hypothetical protein